MSRGRCRLSARGAGYVGKGPYLLDRCTISQWDMADHYKSATDDYGPAADDYIPTVATALESANSEMSKLPPSSHKPFTKVQLTMISLIPSWCPLLTFHTNSLCPLPIYYIVIPYIPNIWYKCPFVTCRIHITNRSPMFSSMVLSSYCGEF